MRISSSRQGLCALGTADGSIRRNYPWGGDVRSGITIAGTAYYGSMDHSVYAVDTSTGRHRWSCRTGSDVQSTPAVAGGTVYFGSEDRYVYALDTAREGRIIRTYPTGGQIQFSAPVVAGRTVYISSTDGTIHAFSTAP